ncbi:MAG: sugar phosphate nucleotidyltransferase, partial [Oscillospiraceae bacterium]
PKTSVRDAISVLVDGKKKAIFIVNEQDHLLGLFTNGDMRKFLLNNQNLSVPVSTAMNTNPIVFYSTEEAQNASKKENLIVFPIVDTNMKLLDAIFPDESNNKQINNKLEDVPLVIMAGGKGTRLSPYTNVLPKALIPIGELTITERIINSFCQYGCNKVIFILNHKAEMIKAYYSESERPYNLTFVKEENFFGTAGGIMLIKDRISSTFFLSNCDILIVDDLACAYETHKRKGNIITFICSMKDIIVPYGVVTTDSNGYIESMNEKPKLSFLVNTGIYIAEPELFNYIGNDEYIDMPDLAKRCMEDGKSVGVFPVSDKAWFDMGQIEEMEKMIKEFS